MKPLEIVTIDLCRPMRAKGLEGELYFMLLIYDYTRMTWVFFLKKSFKSFEFFKIFKEIIENETKMKIKILRLNNGGELIQINFGIFLENME